MILPDSAFEAPLAQKIRAILVAARHDLLPRGLDAVHEALRRGIGEPRQRRGRLMGKAEAAYFECRIRIS